MRGGTVHFVSSLLSGTSETQSTPTRAVVLVIMPSDWLDLQWNDANAQYYAEGHPSAVRVSGFSFRFDYWLASPAAGHEGIQLFNPFFMALAVMDLYDPVNSGQPQDEYPVTLPNYFLRDWGHEEPTVVATSSEATCQTLDRPFRTLHRSFRLLSCGQLNNSAGIAVGAGAIVGRTKGFVLRRRQALAMCLGIYNTYIETNTMGYMLTGHFGYRRFARP